MTSSAQPNEALLAAITSLAALAGEAGEAPLRKLIGELGAAIAASGSGEGTVAPVTAAASTEGASTPRPPARRSTHQAKPRRATRRHGRNYLRDASGRLNQPGRSCAIRFARGWSSKVSASATSPPIERGRRAIRGGDRARLARPSHPISRHGRSGRASFITAVSLDLILDEAKLFLPVRDELDGRVRSGPSPYRPLRERLAD